MPPPLHRSLRERARAEGVSMNRLCVDLLQRALGEEPIGRGAFGELVRAIERAFGPDVAGVALFGSVARKEATAGSDVDLLVVTRAGLDLHRGLYDRFDAEVAIHAPGRLRWALSPHFVTLPRDASLAGGLWFEVALDGIVLWERGHALSDLLRRLRAAMSKGTVTRRFVHGHPYWIRREELDAE
jgi:predicted nucleotidyltransferase